MKKIAWLALWMFGCAGGQTGSPDGIAPAPGDPDYCEPSLTAPTALGITGAQLFELYSGPFDVEVDKRTTGAMVVATDIVTVQIELREADDDAAQCSVVALPVTVTLRGALVNDVGEGTLVGTRSGAFLNFTGERDASQGGSIGFGPAPARALRRVNFSGPDGSWAGSVTR